MKAVSKIMRRLYARLGRSASLAVSANLLSACAFTARPPSKTTIEDRMAAMPRTGLPVTKPVTIHWNGHQIPYIVAESDDDAAFALGLVHAHLRLGQMAIFRKIARGRVAEMCGPLGTDIDHGLRLLDFGRAVPAMLASMPPSSRHWLGRFVDGINHYQERMRDAPVEYRILAIKPEPWSAEDVLTFGRLVASDVTWLVWFNLLKLRTRSDWSQIWTRTR